MKNNNTTGVIRSKYRIFDNIEPIIRSKCITYNTFRDNRGRITCAIDNLACEFLKDEHCIFKPRTKLKRYDNGNLIPLKSGCRIWDGANTKLTPDSFNIEVYTNDYEESPFAYNDLWITAFYHNRYEFNYDKPEYDANDYDDWEELISAIENDHDVIAYYQVYMYDHSGLTVSLSPFSCPWDSGSIGFIYTTRDKVLKCYGITEVDDSTIDRLDEDAKLVIDILNKHIRGIVEYTWEVYELGIDSGDSVYYIHDEAELAAKSAIEAKLAELDL